MDIPQPPADVEGSSPILQPRWPVGGGDRNVKSWASFGPRRAGSVLLGCLYLVLATGMVLFNNRLMHKDRFPFASFLVMGHTTMSLALLGPLWLVMPQFFPSASAVLRQGELIGEAKPWKASSRSFLNILTRFYPLGILGAISLVTTNSAYHYSNVSSLQIIKETSICMVYLFSVLAGVEVLQWRNVCVLIVVTLSAMLAVCGEAHGSVKGLVLQVMSSTCQSAQVVLTSRMMLQGDGPKVDPLTMVLCTAPAMLCALLPTNYILWEPLVLVRMMELWPQLLGNALLAFFLQVTTALTIREIAATGVTLISVLKDLAIVGAAAYLLHEHLTVMQLVGFGGTVAGISVYFWMKSSSS